MLDALGADIHLVSISGHFRIYNGPRSQRKQEISAHMELIFNGTKMINKLCADSNSSPG